MAKKELVLETTESGCIVPTSHKLNKDGYFRKCIGTNKFVMYHRHVWEIEYGSIPEGFEIDHLCKNRACCNLDHLQSICGTRHAIESNQDRYAARKDCAKAYWESCRCTGTNLAKKFQVTTSSACGWIRGWKKHG